MIADIAHKLTTGSLIALTLYYTAFMGSRGADIVQGTCNRFHAAVVDEQRKATSFLILSSTSPSFFVLKEHVDSPTCSHLPPTFRLEPHTFQQ